MKTFKSKIDTWLIALFVVEAVTLLASGLAIALSSGGVAGWVALLIMFGAVLLPVWLVWPTEYMVDGSELRIRSGRLFKWMIALDSITSVQPSGSLISGPALSLDRLKIKYGAGKWVLVSPEDKVGFLRAIGHSVDSSNASTS